MAAMLLAYWFLGDLVPFGHNCSNVPLSTIRFVSAALLAMIWIVWVRARRRVVVRDLACGLTRPSSAIRRPNAAMRSSTSFQLA
ncbi:MAG: hypothetical protein E5Y51_19540 [Mesorhizobium sp.]|nr:MAG: hypothetical protein E5Y51_19540 [Mesorhizobium sp.]